MLPVWFCLGFLVISHEFWDIFSNYAGLFLLLKVIPCYTGALISFSCSVVFCFYKIRCHFNSWYINLSHSDFLQVALNMSCLFLPIYLIYLTVYCIGSISYLYLMGISLFLMGFIHILDDDIYEVLSPLIIELL